jgi:NADH-quinone oxidoreductase subunit G
MCLVEVEKSPKPVASCAMPILDGMVIHTNTPTIKKAREGVMEFLLINHPLDCPICDQGGECDLQDQAFKYGGGKSRYQENKRAVVEKNMGPLVKTEMTRCIHCMRCVRFATDIAGVEEIGSIGRGEHMEVIPYVTGVLTSELSGNIIDLCPVGALTNKPAAFKARSWELASTPSIDVMDAMGSNILVDSRSMEVIRILPSMNEDVNEEWISDKTRFACDGLKNQRIDRPYVKKYGKLMPVSWDEAVEATAKALSSYKSSEIGSIAGALSDLESMYLLKKLMQDLGSSNIDFNQFDYKFDTSSRGNYLFNSGFAGVEKADLCLLIGANPRINAPVLNSRIGRMVRKKKLKVARVGEIYEQNYRVTELGSSPAILGDILDGKHPFAAELKKALNPIIIIGDSAYSRKDGAALMEAAYEISKQYKAIFNVLHNHASTVGALDIGFTNDKISAVDMASKLKCLYLLGSDEIDIPDGAFVIYQGHHGDKGANRADIVLPGCAYTEKDGIYINMEGRAQAAHRAVQAPGMSKDDREILSLIMKELEFNAPANLKSIRSEIANIVPAVANMGNITDSQTPSFKKPKEKIIDKPLKNIETNFYMTDPISRSSVTMAKCVKALG